MFSGSWKTSVVGYLILFGALATAGVALLDGNPATSPDISSILAALAGVGLLAARDDNKTSEQVGAK